MRTLALHTLSTHTAHYTAVTSRETRGNGRLAYPHVHPSERLPDALYGPTRITFSHHIALRLRGRLYTPSRPPYSTHYTVDVTLECQTVVLRTDDFWPANTRVRQGRAQNDRPMRLSLGAIPAARDISVSRSVRSTAECRAATSWSAINRVRASDRCSSR